jgi:hypothetical protein
MSSSIVTLANEGMIRLTDNLIYSIRKTGMKNRIHVLCTDKEVFSYYHKDERVVALFSEKVHFQEVSKKYSNYGSKLFQSITLHKYPGIKQVMKETHDDAIFIDGDISILKNFNSYFDNFKELNHEILCSQEPGGHFCAGLTYFIHCDGALKFIDQHIALSRERVLLEKYFSDQSIFNELANSVFCTTNITRLPESQFCNGYYLKSKGRKEGALNSKVIDDEMYCVHANWIIGIESKICFLRKLGVYFIGNKFSHLRNSVTLGLIWAKSAIIKIFHDFVDSK